MDGAAVGPAALFVLLAGAAGGLGDAVIAVLLELVLVGVLAADVGPGVLSSWVTGWVSPPRSCVSGWLDDITGVALDELVAGVRLAELVA